MMMFTGNLRLGYVSTCKYTNLTVGDVITLDEEDFENMGTILDTDCVDKHLVINYIFTEDNCAIGCFYPVNYLPTQHIFENICNSRHTPNLENGKYVDFEIGEKVKYRMRNGTEFNITINSKRMKNSGYFGYESIFPDGIYFAVAEGIVDWEGKC